jgi:TonB-linked SusC/RagA family outer membrane protein
MLTIVACPLFSQNLSAQDVTGSVTDERGNEIAGVSIVIKGTQTGTVSDSNGRFSINGKVGQVLVFTCLGYQTLSVPINAVGKFLRIELQELAVDLNETVVIGYGSVKKRDLTGSVASLKGSDLQKTNPVSLNQGLQGRLAGVQVQQSDGAPGAGISIQVRGANSFSTSAEPLYVIDGIPYANTQAPATDYGTKENNNPLAAIAPQDIESIEVLKDASATAIYGSRAANGVVLVTTKSGREGKAKVEFSATYSMSKPVKLMDVLSAADFARYKNELTINGYTYDGKAYVDPANLEYPVPGRWSETKVPNPITGEMEVVKRTYLPSPEDFENGYDREGDGNLFYGVNWQDEIFHDAFSKDYNVSVSGGDKNGSYMYSGGYLDQQGIILNSFFKRYTARANNWRKINDFLELGSNISFTTSDNRFARTNSENYGVIESAISFTPVRPVFDPLEDSGYSEDFSTGLANPYLTVRTEKNLVSSYQLSTSSYAQLSLTPNLKFRQNFGYWLGGDERSQYYNRWTGAGQTPRNGYAVKSDGSYTSVTSESYFSFDKSFGIHTFNAVAGTSYEVANWKGKSMTAQGFPVDDTEDNDMSAAIGDQSISSYRGKSQLNSFLFRLNYNLLDRYLFTASVRRDGSSRLVNNRWSNFYSGAVAWRISDEPIIKQLNFFDNLKLRATAGQTGAQGISAYATRSRFTAQNYPYDGTLTAGMAEDRWGGPAAPQLKWETTNQYDLGLDIAFLNNRISMVIDAYYKKTTGLLQYKMIPGSSGFSSIADNYGDVINKGLELSGRFIPVRIKDFTWSVDANISFNRNRVENIGADQYSDVVWGMESMFLRRNGYAIGTLYGYVEDGFYDNESEVRADPNYTNASASKVLSMVGQIKYKNLDDDPVIDNRDKEIIGDTNPDFIYGLTSNLSYKAWTFSIFFQGIQGNDILNANLLHFNMTDGRNMPYFIWNTRWTPENRQIAEWPRPDNTFTRSMLPSDRYVEDGSYLRCKNISLSYLWKKPVKYVESLNVTASVSNLFTISNYSWYDPDVNSFGGDAALRGVDLYSYPSARTVYLGVQLSF